MIRRNGFKRNSSAVDRQRAMSQLGLAYSGKRNIYESAGYDKQISFSMHLSRYLRQGVAKRICNIFADESWRLEPEILDGVTIEDGTPDTPFVEAWNYIAQGGQIEEGETQLGLLHYMHRLDRVAGIGSYGVMLLGLDDGLTLDQPVTANSLAGKGTAGLLYASVFDEGSAAISEYETDTKSPRYGKPKRYQLTTSTGGASLVNHVHWSRIIHVADGALTSDHIGVPRLEAAWNDLMNLEKVMAAVGEAAYRLMDPGHILSTKEGYALPQIDSRMSPDKQAEVKALNEDRHDQVEEFIHGLRRFLELEGMDVTTLDGQLQDPTGAVQNIIDLISAATGIPQRLLLGSERGEQASSQDEANWAKVVESRQSKFITSQIIRPTINRLIWLGVLPVPTSGSMSIRHKSLLQITDSERAKIANEFSTALTKIKAKVNVKEFTKVFIPMLSSDFVEDAPLPPPPQKQLPVVEQPTGGIAINAAFFTDVGVNAYP